MSENAQTSLSRTELVLLWLLVAMWMAVFIGGTLVNSEPFRLRFANLEGGAWGMLQSGLVVAATYTLTNVAILCICAGLLGQLGAKAVLGVDDSEHGAAIQDSTSPRSSAVLRSFFIYLAVIAGVLILGESPLTATPQQYVKLAGAISLIAFLVNYQPAAFGRVLERSAELLQNAGSPKPASQSNKVS